MKEILENNDEIEDALDDLEEVKATASEVVAKPKDVKQYKKADASEMSEEDEKKAIEENTIGEFEDE